PKGRVRVTPGIEPAKVMVVPNSPSERAKAKPTPVTIAGKIVGSVMRPKMVHWAIPTPRADAVISESICRKAESTATTTKGKVTKTCAATTPGKAKANSHLKKFSTGASMPRRPIKAVNARPETTGGIANGR